LSSRSGKHSQNSNIESNKNTLSNPNLSPKVGSKEPILGSKEPILGSKEPKLGSKEPKLGSKEPKLGSKELLNSFSAELGKKGGIEVI
jgi:ribosome assembly protein YihI (activator of Der GTPase)